jgi:hypothetical protein
MNFDTLTTIVVIIGAGALLWFGGVRLGRFLTWIERSEIARQKAEAEAKKSRNAPAPGPAPASQPGAIPAAHLAAISAAVGAIGGAHAIVHISVPGAASVWAVEGRWLQQTSHRPH